MHVTVVILKKRCRELKTQKSILKMGPVRESNPGPLAPEARIIPLDQQAKLDEHSFLNNW